MSGVALHTELEGMVEAQSALSRLADWQIAQLSADAAALIEDQTRVRIADEKASPDGASWADWSEAYAETRHGGHSLLQSENHLLQSVQSYSTAEEAIVGSNLVYAAIHQMGGAAVGKAIPARPYLGLSALNARDLEALVISRAEELLQ